MLDHRKIGLLAKYIGIMIYGYGHHDMGLEQCKAALGERHDVFRALSKLYDENEHELSVIMQFMNENEKHSDKTMRAVIGAAIKDSLLHSSWDFVPVRFRTETMILLRGSEKKLEIQKVITNALEKYLEENPIKPTADKSPKEAE